MMTSRSSPTPPLVNDTEEGSPSTTGSAPPLYGGAQWDQVSGLATFPVPYANPDTLHRLNSATSMESVLGLIDDAHTIAGRYRLDEAIGEGTWGEVMKGVDTVTKEQIAAKATRQGSAVAVESLIREFLAYCALTKYRGRDVPRPAVLGSGADVHSAGSSNSSHSSLRSAQTASRTTVMSTESLTADAGDAGRTAVASVEAVIGLAQVLHFESTLPPAGMLWSAAQPDGRLAPRPASEGPASACLILKILGPSLESLRQYSLGCFDEATILMLADQGVGRLEHMHRSGILHRDLKPENFLMGVGPTAHILYLIDFGLATPFWKDVTLYDLALSESTVLADPDALTHVPESAHMGVAGTQRYASANAMRGGQQSRRDDLIALLHCLVFLATGGLPWQGMMETGNAATVIDLKERLTPAELCADCPYLIDFATSVRALAFDERPAYGALRYDLRKRMATDGIAYDYAYCWTRKRLDELHRAS